MMFFKFKPPKSQIAFVFGALLLLGGSQMAVAQCSCEIQAGSGYGKPNFTDVFPTATTYNGTICVKGTFTQNKSDFTFNSSAVVLMENGSSEIIVPNANKLTISGSTVQRCTTNVAWNRITVLEGGRLDIVNGATISGSANGVVLRGNNRFTLSNSTYTTHQSGCLTIAGAQQTALHTVLDNTFSNCPVGIWVGRNNFVGTNSASNVFIRANTYTTTRGVFVRFGTFVDVDGGTMNPVTTGVEIASSSYVNVKNTTMTASSRGVWAHDNTLKLLVRSNNITARLECIMVENHITQNVNGTFPNVEVQDNLQLRSANYGIRFRNINGTDAVYAVGNRVFEPRIVGIEATNSNSRFSILQNRVANGTNNMLMPGGIRLASCTNQNRVVDNRIELFEFATMNYGILVTNCANNQVVANFIRGGFNTTQFTMDRGIRMENNASGTNLLCCNDVDRCNQGVYFLGTNNSCRFTGTTFRRHTDGLFLDNAQIGDQDWQGNDWRTSANSGFAQTVRDAQYVGNPLLIGNNEFRMSGYLINGTLAKVDPSSGWFFMQNGNDRLCGWSQSSYCGAAPFTLAGEGDDELAITGQDNWAIDGSTPSGYEVVKWENQRGLYEKLLRKPSLVNSSSAVSAFYAAAQNGLVGAFQGIDAGIRALQNPSSANNSAFNSLGETLSAQYGQLLSLNTQIENAAPADKPALEAQRDALLAQIESDLQSYNAIKDQIATDWAGKVNALIAQNSAISPQNQWQSDEKAMNALWLAAMLQEDVAFSSTQEQAIDAVAALCPLAGGRAVYKARELQSYYRVPHWNDQNCLPVDSREEMFNLLSDRESGLNIYPNPASSEITVSLEEPLQEDAMMFVLDLSGKRLVAAALQREAQQLTLPIEHLDKGLYILALRTQSGVVQHRKFVVNR